MIYCQAYVTSRHYPRLNCITENKGGHGTDPTNPNQKEWKKEPSHNMDHHQHDPILKEMPIERIFRKVTGRKMTKPERLCFHLKPVVKPVRKTA
jgi:hypothetical protein